MSTLAARVIQVRAEGEQFDNGAGLHTVTVDGDSFDALAALTAQGARALAAALNAAADKLDQHAPIAYTLL
ncbi:hypothetical protein ABQE44_25610 [Mycolicibacterium sp. XJ2546]